MGQADQPGIFPENADSAVAMTAEQSTRAMWRALEDRMLRLSALAEDMDRAAQEFTGASLSMDVRSPETQAGVFEELLAHYVELEEYAAEEMGAGLPKAPKGQMLENWREAWQRACAIPDGPALPEDHETWAKMRRALRLGRPLARLAREVAEGIGELRKAVRS